MASSRADLTFRTAQVENELGEGLKWCSMSEAKACKEKNFFISGTVASTCGLVEAVSCSWSNSGNRTAFRKLVHLKDAKNPSGTSKDRFKVLLFSSYAIDFDKLNAKEGEFVTIINPYIHDRFKLPSFMEEDDSLLEHEAFVGHMDLSSKVIVHPSIVCLEKVPLKKCNDRVEEIVMTVPKTNPVRRGQVVYAHLPDCKPSKSVKYNVWAVVSAISKFPEPTKKGTMMCQVYITDPYCDPDEALGRPEIQFSIFGGTQDQYPLIRLNSIMRIHHAVAEEYMGSSTLRVFSPNSVTVIAGDVNEPIVPICSKRDLEFTEEDNAKVRELRKWWKVEARRRSHQVDELGLSQTMDRWLNELHEEMPFNLACKVLSVSKEAFEVTDGTLCQYPLLTLKNEFKDTLREVAIFIEPSGGKPIDESKLPKVGDIIKLWDVQFCMIEGGYRLSWAFKSTGCYVFPHSHSKIRDIERKLKCLQSESEMNMDDSSLLKIFQDTQSEPLTTAYPTNIDEMILDMSRSQKTKPPLDLTRNSADNCSGEFFTCPSPGRQVHVLSTNTAFPWTTIGEIDTISAENELFRAQGYVRSVTIHPELNRNLSMLCMDCCILDHYERSKIKCPTCGETRVLVFQWLMQLCEYEPSLVVQSSPTLNVYLSGHHANAMLKITPAEYARSAEVRRKTHQKLNSLIDQPVVVSIQRISQVGKHPGYQIVHTSFVADVN